MDLIVGSSCMKQNAGIYHAKCSGQRTSPVPVELIGCPFLLVLKLEDTKFADLDGDSKWSLPRRSLYNDHIFSLSGCRAQRRKPEFLPLFLSPAF